MGDRVDERKTKADEKVTPFLSKLSLKDWGFGVLAGKRLYDAQMAYMEWRHAHGSRVESDHLRALAVRVSAEAFAEQIAAASGDYDDRTIRWVLAGLRCPSQPFCTGCDACQTITSPERVKVKAVQR